MKDLRTQINGIGGQDYEVYALKYGEHAGYPSFLFHWLGEPPLAVPQTLMTVGYYFWLIKGAGKNILVDVGCTAAAGQAHGMSRHEDPTAILAKMGLAPKDIDAIIISHLDYDHFEGLSLFEDCQAPIYLHQACLDWHLVKARQYPLFRMLSIPSAGEIDMVLKLVDSDRLRLIDCEHGQMVEIASGLYVIRADGHYPGQLCIAAKTVKGSVVLAGDTNYLYSNLEKKWPGGLIRTTLADALDIFPILDMFSEMGGIIVPGHDIAIMDKFKNVQPGVARIA